MSFKSMFLQAVWLAIEVAAPIAAATALATWILKACAHQPV